MKEYTYDPRPRTFPDRRTRRPAADYTEVGGRLLRPYLEQRELVVSLAGQHPDRETVTQVFKSFVNLGQTPNPAKVDTAAVVTAGARRHAVAILKIDGSLIVRSVFQGCTVLH